MSVSELKKALSSIDVDNLYIYIADATRFDCLPQSILEEGRTFKTISASIHTPPSTSTIVTGVHPQKHGVYSFTDSINSEIDTVFDIDGYETGFINSISQTSKKMDPIWSVLGNPSKVEWDSINEKSSFIVVERGKGGHAPYGDFEGTGKEYFEQISATQDIRSDYIKGVNRDASRFLKRVRSLENKGLSNDTLVIYTSDHGELLGEMGMIGHNGPIHSNLVTVPTVFIHPKLETEENTNGIVNHHLINKLSLKAIGIKDFNKGIQKENYLVELVNEGVSPVIYKNKYNLGKTALLNDVTLKYEGVWTNSGGYVFARSGIKDRFLVYLAQLAKSSKRGYLRRQILEALIWYNKEEMIFGTPTVSKEKADSITKKIEKIDQTDDGTNLTPEAEERLQELGYI